jgi:hypothetical protein
MHTENPRIIKIIVAVIVVAVIAVAIVANGAAYLGGTAFVRDVMGESQTTAYVFGGILEMTLAVLSLTVLARSYMLQPTAGVRAALWAAAVASAAFGAIHEIVAYATGEMTLYQAIPAAAWRVGAVAASVALWELVIKLVCGPRAREARDAENQHKLMYRYLKAVQWVGLTQGTRFASLARMLERRARMQTAKHVTPEQRTAILEKFHESQEASAVISVAMASLAQTTDDALRDLGDVSAPHLSQPITRAALGSMHPASSDAMHVQTVQAVQEVQTVQDVQDVPQVQEISPVQEAETYTRTAAATVADRSRAIRADLAAASKPATSTRNNASRRKEAIALIREHWSSRDEVTIPQAHSMLMAAGFDHHERSTGNWLAAAFS